MISASTDLTPGMVLARPPWQGSVEARNSDGGGRSLEKFCLSCAYDSCLMLDYVRVKNFRIIIITVCSF